MFIFFTLRGYLLRGSAFTMPWGGECLLMEEKYYGIILPRLPMSLKRMLESKIAPLPQYRKRSRVNEEMVDVYRKRGTKVEVNPDGEESGEELTNFVELLKRVEEFGIDVADGIHSNSHTCGSPTCGSDLEI